MGSTGAKVAQNVSGNLLLPAVLLVAVVDVVDTLLLTTSHCVVSIVENFQTVFHAQALSQISSRASFSICILIKLDFFECTFELLLQTLLNVFSLWRSNLDNWIHDL